MQSPFIITTTHRVEPDRLDALEDAIERYLEFSHDHERGLLGCFTYLSEDATELSVVSVHRDASAADHHLWSAGGLISGALANTGGNLRIEVCGTPGPLMSQALEHNRANGTPVSIRTRSRSGFARVLAEVGQ